MRRADVHYVVPVISPAAARARFAKFDLLVPLFRTMSVDSGRNGYQALLCDFRPLASRGYAPVVTVEIIDNKTDRTVDRFNVEFK